MYNKTKATATSIQLNTSYEGERIEQKINRIVNNKEPIKDGAPRIYTERKDGVNPAYDIRTDRFELAIDKMDYIAKTHTAKRQERIEESKKKDDPKKEEPKKDSGAEPIQATE